MRLIQRSLILMLFLPGLVWGQDNATTANSDKKTFEGDASVFTNYVWHGISQTKRNPAIQTSLYYNLSHNLKLGAWGTNVSYYGRSKANALLKLQAAISIPFSQNFKMMIHWSDNHYFEPDDRDGNTFGLEFLAFDYSFLIETESNFQGTTTKSRYYAIKRTWDVFTRWKWENQFGYTQFEDHSLSYYMDLRSSIGTSTGPVFWSVAFTMTDNNANWGDAGDYYIILGGTARF